jgi:hypothetical protein
VPLSEYDLTILACPLRPAAAMAADESAMDVDRPSPNLNGSPRRMGIDFVTLGMFIIGLLIPSTILRHPVLVRKRLLT